MFKEEENNMNIAIVGGGYVGLHTALRLKQSNKNWNIEVLDIDKNKVERFNKGESPIDDFFMKDFIKKNPYKISEIKYKIPDGDWNKYDVIFIGLSTNPANEKEPRLNTDLIFKISKEIKNVDKKISIVVRSTINIDDFQKMENLEINYWPEFLSQGIKTELNINQNVNVVAINKNDNVIESLFDEIFINKILIKTNIKEAIFIKVVHNSFDAHLINLTNLFANIAEENKINFDIIGPAVETLLLKRSKVKRSGIGYGGSCYPKDSYSLIEITKNKNNKNLIQALNDFNENQSFAFLTNEPLIRNSKKIVVLGISFKGGTNDITKTPTVSLRKWLMRNKIDYKIWEPMIDKKWTMDYEKISNNIEKDIEESDLVIVASDWIEFNNLLINYSNNVIDLKSFIKENGKMKIYKVGKSRD
ncbi:MAG: UDP-glucose 6-dehydrogenase [Candidatus Tyloplasma litorale]|nr:MAG: UDP-glucose 6-dehydrogenase [Mycoplasmatales bacterium]